MELASGGELFSKVADEGRLPENLARKYFASVLAGAAHCHRHGVAHRDLKLENLMLDASGERVMITDFGFAKNFWQSAPKTCLGTAAYVAPEVLQLEPYDGSKVDAWACGVILFAMLAGDYPFGVGNGKGVGSKGDKALFRRLSQGWRAIDFPKHLSKQSIACMKRLLGADPYARASCEDALDDPWFQMDPAVGVQCASDVRKLRGEATVSMQAPRHNVICRAKRLPVITAGRRLSARERRRRIRRWGSLAAQDQPAGNTARGAGAGAGAGAGRRAD